MGARYLLRRWASQRWPALLATAILAVAACGFVLLAALGAHRTGNAWGRLERRALADDLVLDIRDPADAPTVARQVAALPGVATAATVLYGYVVPEGSEEDFFGGILTPVEPGLLETFWRPVVLSGRLPDQQRPDEVVVNRRFTEVTHLGVGDRVTLTDPLGLIRQPVTIVGVGVLPVDFTFALASPIALPTPAFTVTWSDALATLNAQLGNEAVGPAVVVVADPGVDPAELASRITAVIPPDLLVRVNDARTSAETVTDTLALQQRAFVVLAAVGAVASLAVLALVLGRIALVREEDRRALRAIGLRRRDLRLLVLVPGVVVAVLGAVGGAALGLALHTRVPTGLAADIDVQRAVGDDVGFVALGAAAFLLATIALAYGLAERSLRIERTEPGASRARALASWAPVAVAIGLREAAGGLTRGGRRNAAVAVVAVAVAATGTLVTGAIITSRNALFDQPRLSGVFYDVLVSSFEDPEQAALDRRALLDAPGVDDVATMEVVTTHVDRLGTEGIVVTADRGHLAPPVLAGRAPVAGDEVAVTTTFLRALGKHVGDQVTLDGPSGPRPFRLVGTVGVPFVAPSANGEQLVLSAAGRDALGLEPDAVVLGATLRDPERARALAATSGTAALCQSGPVLELLGIDELPGAAAADLTPCATAASQRVFNLRELGTIPALLVGFLAGLGLAALVFCLGAGLRRAGRDAAVLRAIGFTRRQVLTSMGVHGASVGAVGALVGLPVGILLGGRAWSTVAERLSVVDDPRPSAVIGIAVVVVTVVVGAAVGLVPGLRLLRHPAAEALDPRG